MRRQQQVARQCAHHRESAAIVVDDVRIARVADQPVARRAEAVDVGDAQRLAVAPVVPGPAGAARRMPRREMRGEAHAAQFDDLAVHDERSTRTGGNVRPSPKWRSSLPPRASNAADSALPTTRAPVARFTSASGTGVVDVRVAVQDQLEVAGLHAEFAHVLQQHLRRLRQAAVDQHRALRRLDQHRTDRPVPMYQVLSASGRGNRLPPAVVRLVGLQCGSSGSAASAQVESSRQQAAANGRNAIM